MSRPSSIRDRIPPSSYHAKRVASEALVALSHQRHPRQPATAARRRAGLRAGQRYTLLCFATRPRLWLELPALLLRFRASRRALEAQIAAAALCEERGHVTYLPDRSCPSFPLCVVCVRCGYEHHHRGRR